MTERASTPLSICLSDPQGRGEAVAQEGAQNSVKKRVHFWDPSIKGERAREPTRRSSFIHPRSPFAHPSLTLRPPWLTPFTKCECLKRHGVGEREGELGADLVLLSCQECTMMRCTKRNVFCECPPVTPYHN